MPCPFWGPHYTKVMDKLSQVQRRDWSCSLVRKGWRSWTCSAWGLNGFGVLNTACLVLKGDCEENGASIFTVVCYKSVRDYMFKQTQERITPVRKKNFFHEEVRQQSSLPKEAVQSPFLGFSKSSWIQTPNLSSLIWSHIGSCFAQETGQDNLLRSLPI